MVGKAVPTAPTAVGTAFEGDGWYVQHMVGIWLVQPLVHCWDMVGTDLEGHGWYSRFSSLDRGASSLSVRAKVPVYACVRVPVCACVRVLARARVCVCVRVCACEGTPVSEDRMTQPSQSQ